MKRNLSRMLCLVMVLLFAVAPLSACSGDGPLTIAQDGSSSYLIVYENGNRDAADAAELLAEELEDLTEAVLEVTDDRTEHDPSVPEIRVGRTNRGLNYSLQRTVRYGGYVITREGQDIYILGGGEDALKRAYQYARYFNAKYHRKGRLGERHAFTVELDGLYHTLAAISYVFRNPLHHGITATPLAYSHSSARVIFSKDIWSESSKDIIPKHKQRTFLPSHNTCPEGYRMDTNGLILREDVVDTSDVEHLYGTPRAFLYYMNRLSGEEWQKEQKQDNVNATPITIRIIENGISMQTMEQMLRNEHGRNDYRKMSDINLCEFIDKNILPEIGKTSVYLLTASEKQKIAQFLYLQKRLPEAQIKRCLAML